MLGYLAIAYVVGMLSGLGLFAFYLTYQTKNVLKDMRKDMNKKEETLNKEKQQLSKKLADQRKFNEMVSSKLQEAGKIVEAQNNIAIALQQPSKNSLHSRHKNKMVSDWKTLENEKQKIFTNILKTGADPIINVYDDSIGKTKEMKLSELMQMMGANTIPIEPDAVDKRLQDTAGDDVKIRKVTKNGRTFHVIEGKGNKTEH